METLKPRLELRLGITGHRPPRLKSESIPTIERQLRAVLADIKAELAKIQEEQSDCFSVAPPRLVLVSPLAAGADSIAADVVLEMGADLEVCIPFSHGRYRKDFTDEQVATFDRLYASASHIVSLDEDQGPADEAYEAVGMLTLHQCDILIAIWDGEPAGGQGGTSEILNEAIAEHAPVLVIDAKAEKEVRLFWSGIDSEPHDMPTLETVATSQLEETLDKLIRALLMPPPTMSLRIWDLFGDTKQLHASSIAYPMLMAVTRARTFKAAFRRPTLEDSTSQIEPLIEAFAPGSARQHRVETILEPRFRCADMAANVFALRYRSGFVSNFVMGAVAVLLSLSGLLIPPFKVYFVMAELMVILAIVYRTRKAANSGWHRQWIDARYLAELLRLLSLSSALGRLPLRRRGDLAGPPTMPGWYSRATAREIGVPPIKLSGERLVLIRDRVLKLVVEQRNYHEANAKRMRKIEHWLRHVGDALFVITIFACMVWIIAKMTGTEHGHEEAVDVTAVVTFLSSLLPAVGSALYGIRMHGDFAAAGDRSHAIHNQLERLRVAIGRDPVERGRLSARLRRLTDIMLSEVDQWRLMSEARPSELPG